MRSRDDIVATARGWIGTPYRHQASLKGIGADCLGLVRGVWRELHGGEPEPVPAYGPGEADASGERLATAARRHMIEAADRVFGPGDLLLFRWRQHLPARHAGIASGPGHMIHAQEGVAVAEIPLSAWWLRHLAFVFRFPGVDA